MSAGRSAIIVALIFAIGVPSVAVGFGEGKRLLLGKRNPSANGSLAIEAETEIISNASTYGTRQSNKRDGDGGGAIYGCRSAPGTEPCVRAVNLNQGRAFEFETLGSEGGRIEVADPAGVPFTTNANGVATGLNADRIDGREGASLAAAADFLFAVVDASGKFASTRGGTDVTLSAPQAGQYTVTFNRDVKACSYTANPTGDATAEAIGVAVGVNTSTVVVDTPDAPEQRRGFHLQVIC